MKKWNQEAVATVSKLNIVGDNMHTNDVIEAIATAIQPDTLELQIKKVLSNGIADLQIVDNNGLICLEWHDTLDGHCETCGSPIVDKYRLKSNYKNEGKQYRICNNCASKLPKTNDALDILGFNELPE